MNDMDSLASGTSLSNASQQCSSTDQDIQCADDAEEHATEAGAMSDSSYESDESLTRAGYFKTVLLILKKLLCGHYLP